jgi:pullulanase-type alpha-1,6-glucosidase
MERSFMGMARIGSLVALAGLALAGCGSGSGGSADLDQGGSVVAEAPVTVTDSFNFRAPLDYFVLGTPPIHARFLGGVARNNGAWIVEAGQTAVIDFGTPADAVTFSTQDEFSPSRTSFSAKTSSTGRVSEAVNPPFDAPVFVRGTELGWAAVPAQQLAEVANNVLEVTLPLTTASTGSAGEFKIADAGWANVNCGANGDSAEIALGASYEMVCGTNPPNIKLSVTEDANYKFSLNVADANAPRLTVTKVVAGGGGGGGGGEDRACGLTSQGLDDAAPFGVEAFVRGQINDSWAAVPVPANKLINFGGNLLKVELDTAINSTPGLKNFKIAGANWDALNCGADGPAVVTTGTPYTMQCSTAAGGPPNLQWTPAEEGCYEFALNAADTAAPILTITKADLSGGGEEPADSTEIRIWEVDVLTPGAVPSVKKTVLGSGKIDVAEIRRGGETRITRIEIQNKSTDDIGIEDFSWTANPRFAPSAKPVDVYYRRPSGGYANTRLTIGGTTYTCTPDNAFGCVVRGVPVLPYANVAITVSNGAGTPTESINFNAGDATLSVYTFSGSPEGRLGTPGEAGKPLAAIPRNANEVILFYKRDDGVYTGWGLHLFPTDPATGDWTKFPTPGEYPFEGVDPLYGAYFRITLPQNANPPYSNAPGALDKFPNVLGVIIHKGDEKDPGPDQFIRIAQDGNMLFVVSGVNDLSTVPPVGNAVRIVNAGAHWVLDDTVLWKPAASAGVTKVELLFSPDGTIKTGVNGIEGTYQTIPLSAGSNPQLPTMKHLSTFAGYSIPAATVANAKSLARGQLVIVGRDIDDEAVLATNVQIAGALDDIYVANGTAEDAALGPSYSGGVPSLKVWAPTAQLNPGVSVKVYNADGTLRETAPMTLDANSGVWSVAGKAEWNRLFYTINLRVFAPAANAMVNNEVTDPYSVSLATDSVRSQFVNLDDADLKPPGWDNLPKPDIDAPEDIVVYELHVRDFSINDPLVLAANKGKFTAFAQAGTNGRDHLQQLQQAGLTHVHLLPAFDIATIRERREDRVELDDNVEKLCAANSAAASLCPANNGKKIRTLLDELTAANRAGEEQQQIIEWMRDLDGFNWGYDPFHYGVPEGSYSTNPEGEQRIREFREMVKGLSDIGLGTIMDVVYNHTNASGQNQKSVLDKLVPGYYHRRSESTGDVLKDSCCDDTATEFRMMEKLMVDTGKRWVQDYKIDGFRFDLMSFHTLDAMKNFKAAVQAINPEVYVYGEGWNFGAIQDDKRFVAARQANLGGTGIGSFNDRMRDPVRGGGPFDSGLAHVRNQGFINGQWYAPNAENSGAAGERTALLQGTDNIRVWQAGGLDSYRLVNYLGETKTGREINYAGQESGYTEDPQEAINYVEKHDNETLWDISAYKHAAATPTADRVRAHNVGVSTILLAQGIPFMHAGMELLRSKSMDRNSYDSGDWFNEVDWTGASSKWAVGLPRRADNANNYAQYPAIFANVLAESSAADRDFAFAVTREWLQIRKSSTLFRLRTADQVKGRMTMLNTGADQLPGVVAYRIDGCSTPELTDQPYGAVVTIYNPTTSAVELPLFLNEAFTLHPVQQNSVDPVVKTASHDATDGFTVPARTTAVFVKLAQSSCAPYPVGLFVRGIGGDWSANPARELSFLGGSAYAVSIPVPAANQSFKIADADWTAATNCGGATVGETVALATPKAIVCNNDSRDLGFVPPRAGNYVFGLDATNLASPVLTITAAPPIPAQLFVRGSFTDWGTSAPLNWDGIGKYRSEIVIADLPAGASQFKVADASWNVANCGATAGQTLTLGNPYPLSCFTSDGGPPNIEFTFPSTGRYLFAVDGTDPAALKLTVEKAPFTAALFMRGLNGDWSDAAGNRMTFLGNGIYQYKRALAISTQDFKIADSGWTAGTDCGAASPLSVGSPLVLACQGPGNGNISFAVPAAGTYTFSLDANNPAAPGLVVSGP